MNNKFNMTLDENIFIAKKQIVQNIYSNARIENCNITFPETQTILGGISVSGLDMDDVTCILNLKDAWKYTIDTIDDDISLENLLKTNELVARNHSLDWGVLRYGNVGISGTSYIPTIPSKDIVIQKIEEFNKIDSATEKAIKMFCYICRSQLFWDGNKRTANIFANRILIKNGAGIMFVKDEDLFEFNKLLTKYYDTNEDSKLIEFLYNKCIFGIEK